MSCAGCNSIESSPVTLLDGTVVCSSCEAWRHECEARSILARPTPVDRRMYLEEVEHKRGFAVANELRETIRVLWERRKAA